MCGQGVAKAGRWQVPRSNGGTSRPGPRTRGSGDEGGWVAVGSSRAAYGGQASRGGGENPARERGRLPEYEGGSCGGGPVPAVVEPGLRA